MNLHLSFRTFAVSRIEKTNLFLLAIESTCGKCQQNSVHSNELPGIPGVSKENILFNLEFFKLSKMRLSTSTIYYSYIGVTWARSRLLCNKLTLIFLLLFAYILIK